MAADTGASESIVAAAFSGSVADLQGMGRGCDSGPPDRFLGIFRRRDLAKGMTAAEYLAELDDGD